MLKNWFSPYLLSKLTHITLYNGPVVKGGRNTQHVAYSKVKVWYFRTEILKSRPGMAFKLKLVCPRAAMATEMYVMNVTFLHQCVTVV